MNPRPSCSTRSLRAQPRCCSRAALIQPRAWRLTWCTAMPSRSAWAMHPRTLLLAQHLSAAISRRPFRIHAPALTATKARLRSYVQEWDGLQGALGIGRTAA